MSMNRVNMALYNAAIVAAGIVAGLPDAGAGNVPGQTYLANAARFDESYFSEPLTTYAIGWRDPNNIEETLNFLAPAVQVPRKFEYAEYINAEEFLSDTDDLRALGGDFKRVEFTSKKTVAKTENKGLTIRVDMDEVADKGNWREMYVSKLMRRLLRSELRRAVTLVSAGATNTAKTWDTTAGKDPDQDIRTDLIAAANASGVRPTRILFGDTAFDKRALSHRAQNTAGGYASATLTVEQLAGLLNVDKVMVSRERYQNAAATKAEIVNNLVLEFFASEQADIEDPSNVKRFFTPVDGGGRVRVYEQQVSSKLIDITVEHYSTVKVVSTLGLRKLTIS